MKRPALIAALIVVFAMAGLGSSESATAATIAAGAPAAAATPTPAISLSLTPSESGDLGSGEPLRALVTLNNPTSSDTLPATATLTVDPSPISSRSALADWFAGKSKSALASVTVASTAVPAVTSQLSGGVEISAPASALPFNTVGVYAISVLVTSGATVIGTARSAIAWNAVGSAPVPVAIAVPLTVPAGQSEFLTAAQLSAYTAPGGVLTKELTDVENSQIAIGIDPRIVASIRILGKTAPASSLAWLTALAALPNETFPLAWADADLTAPLHAGNPTILEPKSLDYAIDPALFPANTTTTTTPTPTPGTATGGTTVPTSASLVAWNYTLPSLEWPADNSVEPSDLPALAAAGITSAILTTKNIDGPDLRGLSGASGKSGSTTVAVSDDALSGYLRSSIQSTTRPSSVEAMTELTTTLALMSLESGATPRTVLLTLNRNWVDSDTNFSRSVSEIYSRPWASSVTLSAAFEEAPTGVKLYKDSGSDDRIDLVSSMLAAEKRVVRFAPVAKVPEAITSGSRLQLLSLLSNEWLTTPAAWSTAAEKYVAEDNGLVASVQVSRSSTIVVLANQIALPISISNGLDQAVTVNLAVRPTTALVKIDKTHETQTISIDASSQKRVQIPIEALSNGTAHIVVALTSPTGVPVGMPVTLKVNVQAGWETVGTLVFVAFIVALFVFGIIRNIRKRRRPIEDE